MQLNKILISLGAEDVRLKNLADNKEMTAAQLEGHSRVARETGQAERIRSPARRRFREFPRRSRREDRTSCPTYLVKVRDGNDETVHYFHDERAVRKFHEDNLDLNLFDVEMRTGVAAARTTAPVEDATAAIAGAASWSSCTNRPRSRKSSPNWRAKA